MDIEKAFLGGLAILLVTISFLMVAPFIGYLLTAMIIAFVLKPAQMRLEPYLGPTLATLVMIVIFVGAILAPFGIALNAVVDDASDLVDSVEDTELLDFSELENLISEHTAHDIDIESELRDALERFTNIAVGGFSQIIDVLTGLAIGLLIMMFALFYLLKDGEKLHDWLKSITPVKPDLQDRLYSKASLMTWSVLKGHVLVAIIEGLIGGLGLYLAGVPNFAFWTFIMILLSFIPVVGAFLVWAPASAYLFLVGEPVAGAFLAVYGLVIVSLADNLLRPYLVDKRAEIHPAAILIGVIGGVYVFGAVGLFIGPVIFGFSKTVLEVFLQDYEDL